MLAERVYPLPYTPSRRANAAKCVAFSFLFPRNLHKYKDMSQGHANQKMVTIAPLGMYAKEKEAKGIRVYGLNLNPTAWLKDIKE